ncbi:MAG TPA: hypothetical protein VEX39_15380, partial [Thermoleophilaceae bacterium]|nr:hypothetical protein [Thermoleophilaceae bacterium]
RRGRPDFDLRGYATARGFEFGGDGPPPNFAIAGPAWPEYTTNAMTGALPGGELGMLAHELYEVEVSTGKGGPRMGGALHDERYTVKDPFFFQPSYWKRPKEGPFVGNAIWIPTTKVAARVPQAALAPHVVAMPSERLTPAGRYELDRHGLAGFALNYNEEAENADFLDRLFGGDVGRVLASLDHAFVQLTIRDGTVALVRNGFVREHTQLDELVDAEARIVAGLREICDPWAAPQPFDQPLPPARWVDQESVPVTAFDMRTSPWWESYRVAASDRGLELEDPDAYHRAFPTNPVPGRAIAVLRGEGPDGRVFRLAFHTARQELAERGAVLFAASGTDTAGPIEPQLHPSTDMWFAEGGGVTACWARYATPIGSADGTIEEPGRQTASGGG